MLKSLFSIGVVISMIFMSGSMITVAEKNDDDWEMVDKKSANEANLSFFKDYGENWISTLTHDEKEAITFYTDDNYKDIKYYLRSNKKELLPGSSVSKSELDEKIKLIDSAINKATLPQDITVYRYQNEEELREPENCLKHMFNLNLETNMNNFEEYIKNATTLIEKHMNKPYTALSYTSTSLLKYRTMRDTALRIEITIPKGTHAPYVDDISMYSGEKEILLPRETKFKITGASTVYENDTNLLVIRATVVKK